MSNRLVMGEISPGTFGMRMARAGANVLALPVIGKDTVFDSRWLASSMIVVSGIATLPNTTSAITISYGVTLPSVPVVLCMGRLRHSSIANSWMNLDTYGEQTDYITFGGNQSATRAQAQAFMALTYDPPPSIQKFNNRIVFQTKSRYQEFDRIAYIVLRP